MEIWGVQISAYRVEIMNIGFWIIVSSQNDLRAEVFRESREVAPLQDSHSPGNNQENKCDHGMSLLVHSTDNNSNRDILINTVL